MEKCGWKRLALCSTGLTFLVAVLAIVLFVGYAKQTIHMAFADEQTEVFAAMLKESRSTRSPEEIAGYLEYAQNYYPSGTKQKRGSRLDRTVERNRALTTAAIIERLRTITGADLGDDPQVWVKRYAK